MGSKEFKTESVNAFGKHLAMQTAINAQVIWQSWTDGGSDGEHGMPSIISDIGAAAAIAAPFTGAVIGPRMSPTIARIGSTLRNQVSVLMIILYCRPREWKRRFANPYGL